MTTYFVSRHTGAVQWARRKNIIFDELLSHLDTRKIKAGDRVIGNLPVNLAAQICAAGAQYLHLSLEVIPELRGVELSPELMEQFGVKLQTFTIQETTAEFSWS